MFFALACTVLSVCLQAQVSSDLNSPIPFDPNVRTGVLGNGMTYFIMKNAKPEHRAELRLAVNVGATQENDDQQGLAHFTEHMEFNGSKHFAKNDLVDYIESIGSKFGADLNAYTSFDETVYMLQIPTDSQTIVNKAFLILEDWAHGITEDSVEIDKERGVVVEEWRLGQGAGERMRRQYWPVLFQGSRYADRLPIGKKDIIEHASYETLRSFYRDWYRPENMAVIVIGDVDLDQMEAKVKSQFSGIERKSNVRPVRSFDVPDTKGIAVAKATDKEAQGTAVELIYKAPKEVDKTLTDYRRDLMEELYNSMMTTRLKELTQQADAPFIYANAGYSGLVRTKDAYTSLAVVKDGGLEKGLDALVTENERVQRFGFTEGELDRAKKELMRSKEEEYNERDKTESRKLTYALVAHFLEKEPDPGITYEYNFTKQYLPGVKLSEINALAKKWIHNDNVVAIINAPDKQGVVLPSDDKIKEIISAAAKKDIKPYEDKSTNVPLLAQKPTPGKVTEEKQDKEMGTTTWKLSNGVTVILKPTDFKNDEIMFNSFEFGGTSLYPDKDFMTASHIADIYDNSGVGDFDNVTLQKWLAGKIVGVSPYINDIQQGFTGSCSPDDAETMMQMIYLYFTKPNHNQADFKAYIEKQRANLQNRSTSPEATFQDTVRAVMGQYNYRVLPMTEARLPEIDPERGYQIYKERFSDADGFTFVFVGSIKPEVFKPLVETYLGGLPSVKKKETFKDLGITPPKGKVVRSVHKGVAPKSTVAIKLTGPFDYTYKDRNDLSLLTQLVAIKLREQLREEKSGVYGVGVRPATNHYPKKTYEITISFGCAPENVDSLVLTAWQEIDKIRKNGCEDKDLQKLRETALRQRETDLKENRFWLANLYADAVNNESPKQILGYVDYINSLKGEDFKHLANKYFGTDNVAQFVLYPVK